MGSSKSKSASQDLDTILNFIDLSSGLTATFSDNSTIAVKQKIDGKKFNITGNQVQEVLHREDADGKPFLQVNFKSEAKVLLTDNLIGFKPQQVLGLDMGRLPKVVTTPDLVSVVEAIEDSMSADRNHDQEVEILKKVLLAIVLGAEKIGFTLEDERSHLERLLVSRVHHAA